MDIGQLTGTIAIEDQFSSVMEFAARKVEDFAELFEGSMGTVAVSIGLVTTAVLGVTAAITALGNKGADVNDVTSTFDHFSESAGGAEEVLDGLRSGVKNTVDDMILMKDASRVMSSGAKANADDFRTMAEAAFVLQNRGLGGTAEMLDLISSAMVTGRTRTLAMKLGVVDAADAEQAYADKLGITKSELTQTQAAEAKRQAILAMLRAAVKDAGDQQLDFGEKLEKAEAAVSNWVDELASAVAESPAVSRAIDSIMAALERLAPNGETIDKIVAGINSFANGVTAVVPYVEKLVSVTSSAVSTMWEFREATVAAGAAIFLWSKTGLGVEVIGDLIAKTKSLGVEYGLLQQGAARLRSGLADLGMGWASQAGSLGGLNVALTGVGATIGTVTVAIAGAVAAGAIAYQGWELWRESSERAAAAKRQEVFDTDNLARLNKALGTSYKTVAEASAEWYRRHAEGKPVVDAAAQAAERLKATTEAHNKAVQAAVDSVAQATREYNVSREAMHQLGDAVLFTKDAQDAFMAAMKKLTESGRALTAEEQRRVELIIKDQEATQAAGEARLQANKVTAEMIEKNLAAGASEDALALSLGATVEALKNYQMAAERLRDVKADINRLELEWSGHLADQVELDRQRELEAITNTFTGTKEQLAELLAATNEKYDLIKKTGTQAWKSIENESISAKLQQIRDQEELIVHMEASGNFFRADIDKQREKLQQMKDDFRSMGEVAAVEMPKKMEVTFNSLFEAMAATDRGIDATTIKVRGLDGTVVSLTEAIARLNNITIQQTYDLSTKQGIDQFRRMNTDAQIFWSDEQIMAFAKLGGTLQQLINRGAIKLNGISPTGGDLGPDYNPWAPPQPPQSQQPPTTTSSSSPEGTTTTVTTSAAATVVTVAQPSPGVREINNYFTVNERSTEETAKKIAEIFMGQLGVRTLVPGAR